jgi:hypothetical protein
MTKHKLKVKRINLFIIVFIFFFLTELKFYTFYFKMSLSSICIKWMKISVDKDPNRFKYP